MEGNHQHKISIGNYSQEYLLKCNTTLKPDAERAFYAGATSVLVIMLSHVEKNGLSMPMPDLVNSLVREVALYAELGAPM